MNDMVIERFVEDLGDFEALVLRDMKKEAFKKIDNLLQIVVQIGSSEMKNNVVNLVSLLENDEKSDVLKVVGTIREEVEGKKEKVVNDV